MLLYICIHASLSIVRFFLRYLTFFCYARTALACRAKVGIFFEIAKKNLSTNSQWPVLFVNVPKFTKAIKVILGIDYSCHYYKRKTL